MTVDWPERLVLRDTKVIADEGQRIYTTATGYGYAKQAYVRADLAYEAAKAPPSEAVAGWKLVPVEPTDAMVAAWPHYNKGAGHERAIYAAMLAAAPLPDATTGGMAVKALRWVDRGKVPAEAWGGSVLRQVIGHHDLGRYAGSYTVQEREPGGPWGWWCTWTSDCDPEGVEPSEDAAKAAAQSDYETRIRSALVPAGGVDAVRGAAVNLRARPANRRGPFVITDAELDAALSTAPAPEDK